MGQSPTSSHANCVHELCEFCLLDYCPTLSCEYCVTVYLDAYLHEANITVADF